MHGWKRNAILWRAGKRSHLSNKIWNQTTTAATTTTANILCPFDALECILFLIIIFCRSYIKLRMTAIAVKTNFMHSFNRQHSKIIDETICGLCVCFFLLSCKIDSVSLQHTTKEKTQKQRKMWNNLLVISKSQRGMKRAWARSEFEKWRKGAHIQTHGAKDRERELNTWKIDVVVVIDHWLKKPLKIVARMYVRTK